MFSLLPCLFQLLPKCWFGLSIQYGLFFWESNKSFSVTAESPGKFKLEHIVQQARGLAANLFLSKVQPIRSILIALKRWNHWNTKVGGKAKGLALLLQVLIKKSHQRAALLSWQNHSSASGLCFMEDCSCLFMPSSPVSTTTSISLISMETRSTHCLLGGGLAGRRWNTRSREAGLSSAPLVSCSTSWHVPTDDCDTGKGDTCWAACLGTAQLQEKPSKSRSFYYI